MKHTIQVCVRCNFTKTDEERHGERGGAKLMNRLVQKFEKSEVREHYNVEGTGCVGACLQACIVTFQAPGKITWVFGDLNPRFSIPSLIEFAELYFASENGMVSRAKRPPEMANGLITRVHPVGTIRKSENSCNCMEDAEAEG